jgi:hypothetical protein
VEFPVLTHDDILVGEDLNGLIDSRLTKSIAIEFSDIYM